MKKVWVLLTKDKTPVVACLCEEGALYMMAKLYYASSYEEREMSQEDIDALNEGF